MTKFPNFSKLTEFRWDGVNTIRHPEPVEGSVPFVAAVYDRRVAVAGPRDGAVLLDGSGYLLPGFAQRTGSALELTPV